MNNRVTVLLSSAGRRAQLLGCFRDSAQALGVSLRVVACDAQPELSAACQLADQRYRVPRCAEAGFIPALVEICRREQVRLLVPTIDTELQALSDHREAFAAVGTRVVVSAPATVSIARDKRATATTLTTAGIDTPRTMTLDEFRRAPEKLNWPVIAKPVGGSASLGIVKPRRADELLDLPGADYVVQELLSGREYTVNAFFDAAGRLQCAVPHLRLEVRGGEVSKGRTERVPALESAARTLAAALPGASGPVCFQAMVTESGRCSVFEINARFGGGYPLTHRAGATFARWLLEETLGLPCSANDDWKPGVTMLRYDEAVFIDG